LPANDCAKFLRFGGFPTKAMRSQIYSDDYAPPHPHAHVKSKGEVVRIGRNGNQLAADPECPGTSRPWSLTHPHDQGGRPSRHGKA
jgi:hypothetical protein